MSDSGNRSAGSQPSSSRRGLGFVLALVFAVPVATALFFFLGARFFGFGTISGSELIAVDAPPGAMAATADGGLVYGERTTGRIFAVAPDGDRTGPLTEVPVRPDGQRGLLGLAARADGTLFFAWVDPDGRLLLGRLDHGAATPEVIWEGPATSERGNGGHLELASDGSVVIGISDHGKSGPEAPNGELLRVDPDGPADQTPEVISGGWHDPLAFAFTPDGSLWIADASTGEGPERLARGDGADVPLTELDERLAPTALVAVNDTTLVMCGSATKELTVYRIDGRGQAYTSRAQPTLATDCEGPVALLADGRLAYASGDAIRIAEAP